MNRVLTLVGSGHICKVRLRGPEVSRFHCGLVSTPAGVWVIDLKRRGGVDVNGLPVGHALLEDGDQLHAGSFTICLSYDSPLARMPAPGLAANSVADAGDRRTGNDLLTCSIRASTGLGLSQDPKSLLVPPSAPPSVAGQTGALSGETCSADLVSSLLRQFSQTQHQMFDQSLVMMFQMFRAMHVEQVGILREELGRLDDLNQELQALLAERLKDLPAPTPLLKQAEHTRTVAGAPPTSRGPAALPSGQAKTAPVPPPVVPPGEDVHIWLCQRMEAIQEERQGIWQRIAGALKKSE
jgi:hypothetical protein